MDPIKFKSIVIVTYGRSGSTLLQGVLNTINGVTIRGENQDFCWGLYKAWKSLTFAKNRRGGNAGVTTSPWYGADRLNPDIFLQRASDLLAEQLIPENNINCCFGFKEIRYINHLEELTQYLRFLEKILPASAFIFNTREHTSVMNSGFWQNTDRNQLRQRLSLADRLFYEFARKNENAFIMRYENLIRGAYKISPLFDFLGTHPDIESVNEVLDLSHSYAPNQETLDTVKKNRAHYLESHVEKPVIGSYPDGVKKDDFSRLEKLNTGAIVAATVRDEIDRIPWFVDYYRKLGCVSFMFIDNGSTDGTVEFLRQQPDVMLFNADPERFSSSRSGRNWINNLAQKHAMHRWLLCVDADELLCWPNHKAEGLDGLARRAERLGLNRVFTPMVDAYSETPTDHMPEYIPGTPFDQICPWIDPVETLKHHWSKGRLILHGGPRARFTSADDVPPLMTKQTFYFVEKDGFRHLNAHFDNYRLPSPLVAPLLHYRFMPDFSARCGKYIEEGYQWKNAKDYRNYKKRGLQTRSFKLNNSIRVTKGSDLEPYIEYVSNLIIKRGMTGSIHLYKPEIKTIL